jgi:ferredoxin-thioredoxin reductase catalytic chain
VATHNAPTSESVARIERLVHIYTGRSGTTTHPDHGITKAVVQGLAHNLDKLGRPLCPCRFYPNAAEEVKHRTWICPCDDMQIYKYCHCLLFVNGEGEPVTEYLPENHPGRSAYGLVKDPAPDQGRPLRAKAAERERERQQRHS